MVLRRLNRDEYVNTIRDLLGVFQPEWKSELPLDGKAGGFDTVGRSHTMSTTALSKYLNMAERVIEEVFEIYQRKIDHPSQSYRFEAEDHATQGFDGFRTIEARYQQNLKRILSGAVVGDRRFLRQYPNLQAAVRDGRPTNPEERAAMKELLLSNHESQRQGPDGNHGNLSLTPMVYVGEKDVRLIRYWYYNTRPGIRLDLNHLTPGYYRARIRAKGDVYPGAPLSRTVWMRLIENKKTAQPLYVTDVPLGEYQEFETTIRVSRGMKLWVELMERTQGGPKPSYPGDPNLWVDYVEFEGPILNDSGYQQLFAKWDGTSSDESSKQILGPFMERAWRRPVSASEIDSALQLVDLNDSAGFIESIKAALRFVISSPRFLYLVEPTTSATDITLTDFEVASRLSYFLGSTMPDDELYRLAANNELKSPVILRQQVERLLQDEKADRFAERFVTQWLELEKLAPLIPDKKLYPSYDKYLAQCFEQEAILLFREILHHDLSVLNLLDSNFTMLNERLAQHYHIDGVSGSHFRRVQLATNSRRGGLFGLGAIQTLTFNGTRTSPVIRGKWILENILADPPTPPPPNVGALEDVPDIEGQDKLTVRELLDKHREVASCNNCHRKIDPYGIALENFDAVGQWRTHEMDYNRQTGTLVSGKPIDPLAQFPSGDRFTDLTEFKQLMRHEEERFLLCLSEKILTYALGRTLEFGDEAVKRDLVASMKREGLTLRSLINAIVQHEVFRTN